MTWWLCAPALESMDKATACGTSCAIEVHAYRPSWTGVCCLTTGRCVGMGAESALPWPTTYAAPRAPLKVEEPSLLGSAAPTHQVRTLAHVPHTCYITHALLGGFVYAACHQRIYMRAWPLATTMSPKALLSRAQAWAAKRVVHTLIIPVATPGASKEPESALKKWTSGAWAAFKGAHNSRLVAKWGHMRISKAKKL